MIHKTEDDSAGPVPDVMQKKMTETRDRQQGNKTALCSNQEGSSVKTAETVHDPMKTGLIMEGGAMRGMFTAGVTDVLMENGIEFDGAIGVSAGATFGVNYKSRQPGRVLRYNRRFAKEPRYCSIRSLIQTGDLYGAEFCYRILPKELDIWDTETFAENPMTFYVVGTDVNTGRPMYHRCSDGGDRDLKWIQGSASMPFFAKPVSVDGKMILDGGLSDSVPLKFFEHKGYHRNVVLLTQPAGYRKTVSRMMPLIRFVLRKMPAIVHALERRASRYNRTMDYIDEKERQGEILVIRPPEKLAIGKMEHNPEKMQSVYDIGREEGLRRLEDIKMFLGLNPHLNQNPLEREEADMM